MHIQHFQAVKIFRVAETNIYYYSKFTTIAAAKIIKQTRMLFQILL